MKAKNIIRGSQRLTASDISMLGLFAAIPRIEYLEAREQAAREILAGAECYLASNAHMLSLLQDWLKEGRE